MSISATYISEGSFSVTGDRTDVLYANRRIKADINTGTPQYGTIIDSSYSTVTTVDVAMDDTCLLTEDLLSIDFGELIKSIPVHSHTNYGNGGTITELVNTVSGVYPTHDYDLATKEYVDDVITMISGLSVSGTEVLYDDLSDSYFPYYSSSTGLTDSNNKITSTSNFYTSYTPENVSYYTIDVTLAPQQTSSSTVYDIGYRGTITPIVNSGITNSGYSRGQLLNIQRNYHGSSDDDNGTLSSLAGMSSAYGHNNKNTSASPKTNFVYGIYLQPIYITGTITSLYDIYIGSDITGGTVTNRYGIYQNNSGINYFGGSVGIGTTKPQNTIDLGNGSMGRCIVWGGPTGTKHYATIGTCYSSGDLVLGNGIKLSSSSDILQYSYTGATGVAGIRLDYSTGRTYFFNKNAASVTAGDTFAWDSYSHMIITGAGNVGIGTTSPAYPLHVYSASTNLAGYFVNAQGSATNIGMEGSVTGSGTNCYGTYGYSNATGSYNYGIFGYSGGAGSNNYGVYGQAINATNNWAGYFVGNTYISANLGIGTTTPTEALDINSDAIRIRTSQTPATSSGTGDTGMICWDSDYVYVCVNTNTWKRASLATW